MVEERSLEEISERKGANMMLLDLITGESLQNNERGAEGSEDDARFYIYESICQNCVTNDNIGVYIELYDRLCCTSEPTCDDGQVLMYSIS